MINLQNRWILTAFKELINEGLDQAKGDKSKESIGYQKGLEASAILLERLLTTMEKMDEFKQIKEAPQ
jgi:hypothetical protein